MSADETRPKCPSDEELLEAAETRDSSEILDHALRCPRCALKLEALNALRRDMGPRLSEIPEGPLSGEESEALRKRAEAKVREIEGKTKAGARRRAKPLSRISVWTWAAAAGVLAVVLGGLFFVRDYIADKQIRDTNPAAFRLISPLGRLKEAPGDFSWTPKAGTDAYKFKLIDEKLQTVFEGSAHGTTLTLDPAVRARIEKKMTYLWSVQAISEYNRNLGQIRGTFIIE